MKKKRGYGSTIYETIAFAKSSSGRMVSAAMGTASTAGKISRQMEVIYSVKNDW